MIFQKRIQLAFLYLNFVLLEFDCPEDGTCSNQGVCDDTVGSCICYEGFEGNICKGDTNIPYFEKAPLKIW